MYETEVNGKRAKINHTIWSDVFICSNCNKELTLWNEAVNLERTRLKKNFLAHIAVPFVLKRIWKKRGKLLLTIFLVKPLH